MLPARLGTLSEKIKNGLRLDLANFAYEQKEKKEKKDSNQCISCFQRNSNRGFTWRINSHYKNSFIYERVQAIK